MNVSDTQGGPRQPSGIRWPRVLGEGAIIVASILLAFGIDAAWSERQERAEAEDAVRQLDADFVLNATRLDSVRAVHEMALDASYELLDLAGADPVIGNPQGVAPLVRLSIRAWTYDPFLGGINSLIQSGRLGLLQSDELRVAMSDVGGPVHLTLNGGSFFGHCIFGHLGLSGCILLRSRFSRVTATGTAGDQKRHECQRKQ